MVHAEDITEQRQARASVAREHNLLRAVIDILPDYIFAKDRAGHFTLTNIAHAHAAHVTPAEMLGKNAYDLFPPEFAAQFNLDDEAIMESGKALINVQRETQDAEGNRRTVLTSKVPLSDAQNNIIGLVGISRDVTDLTTVQEALRESEAQSRAILAALAEAIILRNSDGTLEFLNPSAERITETLVKDDDGRPNFYEEDGSLIKHEDRPSTKALRTGVVQQDVLLRVMRESGEIRWVSLNAQPLYHAGESVPYATVSSFTDVTERLRFEQTLAEARDQALEASRAKSTFLATMSHEIRTPMNGVIGMTDLVLETALSQDQREMVEVIRSSANTLLSIINDVLDFSKIEAGKLNLESIALQTVALVEGAADIIAPKAHEKELSLMTFVDPAIPAELCGDSLRLHQILVNLIGNAVKFTEHGEVVVRAQLEVLTLTQATVRFSVTDSGIGLSESVQKRLFVPFMQADDSTTRRYGGTGLGLAICARLVELMDGNIGVESHEGAGSCFWFSIPLKRSSSATNPILVEPKAQHVLIADDNEMSREIIATYLSAQNKQCECATDSDSVLYELRRAAEAGQPYDVLILDPILQPLDGFALATTIKQNTLISATHIVLLTDSQKNVQAALAQPALFSTSLSKPVKQQQLLQALENLSQPRVKAQTGRLVSTALTSENSPILLVEDNPINQKVAAMQLKKLGLNVQTASNGEEALNKLAASNYSLILMDCQMPVIDGFEATRRIRLLEANSPRHIPIVAMTANAMQGDRELCLAAGMDDYLAKPINLQQLQTILQRWLPTS
jgi:PAS domain S-box-containing protein